MSLRLLSATAVAALGLALQAPASVHAAEYTIDSKGAHASINFRVKHLGFSWLVGRFDTFTGEFTYDDAKPEASKIAVEIETASVNSNHAERDKHLKGKDFLEVETYPNAKFVSKSVKPNGDGKATVTGDLTLHGVTKEISIDAEYIGGGKDPWGGFRQGFMGTTSFPLADFGIDYNLGPASRVVELTLHVEGVMKK